MTSHTQDKSPPVTPALTKTGKQSVHDNEEGINVLEQLTSESAEHVETVIGKPALPIRLKQSDSLDDEHQDLVRRSPIAGIGYLDENDQATSNVIGGAVGFAIVIDERTISFSIPSNVSMPQMESGVGMVFMFPGIGETLRLNGKVLSVSDNHIVLTVEEVYMHCSRATSRSGLWNLPVRPLSEADGSTRTEQRESSDTGPLYNADVARVMSNSPFLFFSSFGSSKSADTSPRGDAPGFVHRLSGNRLAIPDRKGNKRADTFHNLAIDQRIAFAALVPGTGEIAVISGVGAMSTDPALLQQMALNATAPSAAIIMDVTSARVITASALMDAGLWTEDSRALVSTMPDMNALAAQQIAKNMAAQSHSVLSLILRSLNMIPGLMSALTRFGLNRELADEGYGNLTKEPDAPAKRQARVISVKHETDDVISVLLKDVDRRPFEFKPGQYFTVAFKIDGKTHRRAYSASQVAGPVLRLTIKRQPHGIVSNYFHDQVQRGAILELSGPNGDFTPLSSTGSDDLVLIGAGSGITPLFSAAVAALQSDKQRRVILLYACQTEKDIVFDRSLRRLVKKYKDRFVLRIWLNDPSTAWTGYVGRISDSDLPQKLAEIEAGASASYWICGPSGMMEATSVALRDLGVVEQRIHQEQFVRPHASEAPQEAIPVTVVSGSEHLGHVTVEAGETILDVALDENLPMKYSCTMGDCGECAVRLLEGSVEMSSPNCLSNAQIEDNIVLTCVGRPTSATVIDIDYTLDLDGNVGTGFETWTDGFIIEDSAMKTG